MPRAGKAARALALACSFVPLSLCPSVPFLLTACGTPGAPQPPSLNLPDRVGDLTALRTGNQVALSWTMPRRSTDRLLLKGDVPVRICLQEGASPCAAIGSRNFAPGADASFGTQLPAPLSSGPARPIRYFVELLNSSGRSAGQSNPAAVLAGEAPAPVDSLGAEVRKSGVVLRWTAADPQQSIRLRRTMLSPPQKEGTKNKNPFATPPEQPEQNLIVPHDPGIAIDKEVHFGQTYEYRAQRVAIIQSDGKSVELAGAWSAPIRVPVADVFPPAVPSGLAAVATAAAEGAPASIDLNWQPVADPTLSGYVVYRREQQGPWQRISGDQPVAAPAFHDAQVQPAHTYTYAVTSIDQKGNESPKSPEATETVPQQ